MTDAHTPFIYVTDRDLAARYGICRCTVWEWSKNPNIQFPAPVRLAPGTTRWRLPDIEKWEAQRQSEMYARAKEVAA